MIRLAVLAGALASAAAGPPPPGAVSCTGCHVPGGGMGRLAGVPAAELVIALEGYRSGTRPATMMNRIVKGFSAAEVQALAAWFEAQR